MEEKLLCSVCGKELTEDNIYDVGEKHLCIDCFESRTSSCSYCGERIWTDEVFGDEYIVLCRNCYDRYYTQCEECGIVIHAENAYYNDDDEENPYCSECYNKLFRSAIKSYNYKPEPIFYGSGSLYFGVEIEVDKGGEDNQNAKEILDIANENSERLYAKHDGSIYDGFELVSHPRSIPAKLRRILIVLKCRLKYIPAKIYVNYLRSRRHAGNVKKVQNAKRNENRDN